MANLWLRWHTFRHSTDKVCPDGFDHLGFALLCGMILLILEANSQ